MNIIRKTKNKKKIYFDKKTRRKIKSKKIIEQINSMNIPPNYNNVQINTNKQQEPKKELKSKKQSGGRQRRKGKNSVKKNNAK